MQTIMNKLLGRYELTEKLGEGGFGIVYKARDAGLDRFVAIKILRSDLASSVDFVERFRKEARLAASLRHPNIVSVIEVGEQDGSYYLVMEYLGGQSLANLMKPGEPLPLKQAIELLEPIAEALDYAHSRGMVHRDVKPSNVIFSEDGRLVLTDFGLVKSTQDSGTTTTGTVLGTAEYMAPEQILGKEVTAATDLYGLAVIAYQMLTGKPPFSGNTPFEIQEGHVHREPPDPSRVNPSLSKSIGELLIKALSKDTAQRFISGKEFIDHLQQVFGKISREEVDDLLVSARSRAKQMDFSQAVTLLEKAEAIYPTSETQQYIQEYRRRQAVLTKKTELEQQQRQIIDELDAMNKSESWLRPEPQPQLIQNTQVTSTRIPSNTPIYTSRLTPINWNDDLDPSGLSDSLYRRQINKQLLGNWVIGISIFLILVSITMLINRTTGGGALLMFSIFGIFIGFTMKYDH